MTCVFLLGAAADLYPLVSLSFVLFFTVKVTRRCVSMEHFLNTLLDSPWVGFAVAFNFLLSVLLTIYRVSVHFLYGKFKSKLLQYSDSFTNEALSLFFLFLFNSYGLTLDGLFWAPIALLIMAMSQFSVVSASYLDPCLDLTKREHRNFFLFDLFVMIVSWYFLVSFCRWGEDDMMFFVLFYGMLYSWCSALDHFICHLVLLDREHDDLVTAKRCFRVEMCMFAIELTLASLAIVHMIIKWQPTALVITSGLYVMMKALMCEHEYRRFRSWQEARKPLDGLPNASTLDIIQQDCCIICRQAMTASLAKRLPCHHCMHLSCLIKWIEHQRKCPLCQTNLSTMTKFVEDPYFHEYRYVLYLQSKLGKGRASGYMRYFEPFDVFALLLRNLTKLREEERYLEEQYSILRSLPNVTAAELEENYGLLRRCRSLICSHDSAIEHMQTLFSSMLDQH